MSKNSYTFFIIILFSTLANAQIHTLQSLNLDVLEPAKKNLFSGIEKLLIVFPASTHYSNYSINIVDHDRIIRNDKDHTEFITNTIMDKVYDVFSESPAFTDIEVVDVQTDKKTFSLKDYQFLCEQHHCDGLIYLKDLYFTLDSHIENQINATSDSRNKLIYKVMSHISWSVYHKKTNRATLYKWVAPASAGYKIFHDGTTYNSIESIIEEYASINGLVTAKSMVPHWKTISRRYYRSPGKRLRKAHRKIKKGKVHEAVTLWMDANLSDINRGAFNYKFNQILGLEITNKLNKAVEKSKELSKIHPYNEVLNDYIKTLQQRMKDLQTLKEQIN
jgi:hypothetical protein